MANGKQRVLDLDNYRAWRPVVMATLATWVGRDVLQWLKTNPPRGFYADNLSWLDQAVEAERGVKLDIKQILTKKLPECFQFVRSFHGTRAASEESFRKRGLLPSGAERLRAHAHSFLDAETLARAAQELNGGYLDGNKGRVCFCPIAEELLEHAGHYLIYGSELLQGAFSHEKLKQRGRPMLMECRVPTNAIGDDFLECFAGRMLKEIAEKFCVGRVQRNTNFGFWIMGGLAPENIIKIHYPKRVRDHFAGVGGYWEA